MIRRFALIAAFLVAGHASASAQHPGHPGMPEHYPGMHGQIDSAQHALLHQLMHGSWSGTFSSPHGTGDLDLAVLHDTIMKTMHLNFSSNHMANLGTSQDFGLRGDTLVWTQQLKEGPCQAFAVLTPGSASTPDTMQGSMDCDGHKLSFTLQKKTR